MTTREDAEKHLKWLQQEEDKQRRFGVFYFRVRFARFVDGDSNLVASNNDNNNNNNNNNNNSSSNIKKNNKDGYFVAYQVSVDTPRMETQASSTPVWNFYDLTPRIYSTTTTTTTTNKRQHEIFSSMPNRVVVFEVWRQRETMRPSLIEYHKQQLRRGTASKYAINNNNDDDINTRISINLFGNKNNNNKNEDDVGDELDDYLDYFNNNSGRKQRTTKKQQQELYDKQCELVGLAKVFLPSNNNNNNNDIVVSRLVASSLSNAPLVMKRSDLHNISRTKKVVTGMDEQQQINIDDEGDDEIQQMDENDDIGNCGFGGKIKRHLDTKVFFFF